MLDLERFLDDCQRALAEAPAERAMRELVARAVSEPLALLQALGEPKRAEIQTLHRSSQLTLRMFEEANAELTRSGQNPGRP